MAHTPSTTTPVTFRLETGLVGRLRSAATDTGRTQTHIVETALRRTLVAMEHEAKSRLPGDHTSPCECGQWHGCAHCHAPAAVWDLHEGEFLCITCSPAAHASIGVAADVRLVRFGGEA